MPDARHPIPITLVFLVAAQLAACGGTDPTGTENGNGGEGVQSEITVVQVTPGADTLTALGATRELKAVARDAAGNEVTGVSFTWSSSNEAVVSVDASGDVTAQENGAADITATASGVSGTAEIAVLQRVETVTVSPGTITLTTVGATHQFSASAADANDNEVEGAVFVWDAEDPTVATVDRDGLATAKGMGQTTVRATSQDVPAFAELTVDQAADHLEFVVEPTDVTANEPIAPAAQVEVLDADGNRVEHSGIAITLALGTNPSGGVLYGTKTVHTVAGVATFSGLSIDYSGTGYALEASSGTLTGATSAPFDVLAGPAPAGVTVLVNTNYVDFNASRTNAEASNVVLSLESFALDVATFVDIGTDNIVAVTRDTRILVIPELEQDDVTPDLSPESRSRIVSFVENGGTLLVFATNFGTDTGRHINFLNTLFGYSTLRTDVAGPYELSSSEAAGTPFAFGPPSIPAPSATRAIDETTLPAEALVIYEAPTEGDAAVSLIPRGDGEIVVIGWDWFEAPPNGSADDGGWLEVLRRATEF